MMLSCGYCQYNFLSDKSSVFFLIFSMLEAIPMSVSSILLSAYKVKLVIWNSFSFPVFLQDALVTDNCDRIRILMRFVVVLVGLCFGILSYCFILPKLQIGCYPSMWPILKFIFHDVLCITSSSSLAPVHACLQLVLHY